MQKIKKDCEEVKNEAGYKNNIKQIDQLTNKLSVFNNQLK